MRCNEDVSCSLLKQSTKHQSDRRTDRRLLKRGKTPTQQNHVRTKSQSMLPATGGRLWKQETSASYSLTTTQTTTSTVISLNDGTSTFQHQICILLVFTAYFSIFIFLCRHGSLVMGAETKPQPELSRWAVVQTVLVQDHGSMRRLACSVTLS